MKLFTVSAGKRGASAKLVFQLSQRAHGRQHVATRRERLRAANVEALIAGNEVVIDGADNFPTRYLLDAACRRLKIPLVYGAVHRFTAEGSLERRVGEAQRQRVPPGGSLEAGRCGAGREQASVRRTSIIGRSCAQMR